MELVVRTRLSQPLEDEVEKLAGELTRLKAEVASREAELRAPGLAALHQAEALETEARQLTERIALYEREIAELTRARSPVGNYPRALGICASAAVFIASAWQLDTYTPQALLAGALALLFAAAWGIRDA